MVFACFVTMATSVDRCEIIPRLVTQPQNLPPHVHTTLFLQVLCLTPRREKERLKLITIKSNTHKIHTASLKDSSVKREERKRRLWTSMNFNFTRFSSPRRMAPCAGNLSYTGYALASAPPVCAYVYLKLDCEKNKLLRNNKKTLKKWHNVRDAKAQIIVQP